jgi:transcriptional regulator with XRE-family HTH domain
MNRQILETKLAEKNKNQREMCEEIGMVPQRLSDMIKGRLQGWKYRRRICQYLGVQEEILFPEDGDKQNLCQPG